MYSTISKAAKPKNSITSSDPHFPNDSNQENCQDYTDSKFVAAKTQVQGKEDKKNVDPKKSVKFVASKRNFAEALHQEADLLHHRGDYESALYLYHRAASLYPRELRHSAATIRTTAAITSAINPLRTSKKILLAGTKNLHQVAAYDCCPETAALMANKIIKESLDPVSSIKQILDYFDSRKNFWQGHRAFQYRRTMTKSKAMLKQSSTLESNTLKNLQAAFASGDLNKSLKIGVKLLAVSESLANRYHYQVAAYHYFAMIEINLGRHDRAVDQVSTMVRLARLSGDVVLWSRSMMTLGKVHLSFRHFDAAAKAWERLVLNVDEAIPKAWLLHEIGRCYFEMKLYDKALKTAARCIEFAQEANSPKWLMHGQLLNGQTLVELGRYGEAIGSLTLAEKTAATNDKNDQTIKYLSNLINQVHVALRKAIYPNEFVSTNGRPMDIITSTPNTKLNSTKETYLPSDDDNKKILARPVSMKKSKTTLNVSELLSRKIELLEKGSVKSKEQRKNIMALSKPSESINERTMEIMRSTRNSKLDSTKQKYLLSDDNKINILAGTLSMKMSTATTKNDGIESLSEKIEPLTCASVKSQRQRKKCLPSPKPPGTFHFSMRKNEDVNRLASVTSGIEFVERFSNDVSSLLQGNDDLYESGDDMVTYRTRVIEKETSHEDVNTSWDLECSDERKIVTGIEQIFGPHDEQPLSTGRTYVVE